MRWIVLALALSMPFAARAACTWTAVTDYTSKNVCEDGDEVAPTAATEGFALKPAWSGVKGLVVWAVADLTRTITSGTLKAYVYNSDVALWARAPELDLTISEAGNRADAWSGMTVPVAKAGHRIAWVPSVVTLSAGGITIWVIASTD